MAVLGAFFPRYRPLISNAQRCFWDKLRLRPCQMEFDKKVKARLVSKLIKKDRPKLANFVNRYFELIMTIIGIIMIILIVYSLYLFIDWILLGNKPCNDGLCEV
jgi:hypothetical protein